MNQEELHQLRHSLAHLLGATVVKLYPGSKLTIGPSVDNGFYYDVDTSEKITENDLEPIEKEMRNMLKSWSTFSHKEVSADEAREFFKDNEYKIELINELAEKGEKITLYTSGDFTDLCRGGHVENMNSIDPLSFKIDRVAGAYWRGDEKNKMLTRVYGLAFESKVKLDEYLTMTAEAKKRDHRKIGQELDLFTFSPLVGSGLPLWTPRGTIIREELHNFVWDLRKKYGYQKVTIPHITKKDLYETSGHWEKFSGELFKITTREGKEYAMKPMNCPHHTQIFNHLQRSYRDMPQRYAETTMVYRDEQSGELGGLTRVLSITQDDAHVFCRHSQLKEEFFAVWDIIHTFYGTFGFELRPRLSFHDPEKPEKYLGTPEIWNHAESVLKEIAEEKNADYFIGIGEAAMYGPKLDFMAKDSLGREHQVATIQLDMNLPERFDLFCINEKGEKERIVMLHCAIMGSIERFSAVLLEHTSGTLPTFLSPEQITIIPVKEEHEEAAQKIAVVFRDVNIRTGIISSGNSLGKRIHEAKSMKTPYIVVLGDKEIESGTLTIETRAGEKISLTQDQLLEKLTQEISSRS